jgi:hypothetical protein
LRCCIPYLGVQRDVRVWLGDGQDDSHQCNECELGPEEQVVRGVEGERDKWPNIAVGETCENAKEDDARVRGGKTRRRRGENDRKEREEGCIRLKILMC